jgi:cytochrome P450
MLCRWFRQHVGVIRGIPLVDSADFGFFNSTLNHRHHNDLLKLAEKYGGIAQVRYLGSIVVVVTDPQLAMHVLTSVKGKGCIDKGAAIFVHHRNMLNIDTNAAWQHRRMAFRTALSAATVAQYEGLIGNIIGRMILFLDDACNDRDPVPLLIDRLFENLAIDVLCEVLFQLDSSALHGSVTSQGLSEALHDAVTFADGLYLPSLSFLLQFPQSLRNCVKLLSAKRALHQFGRKVLTHLRSLEMRGLLLEDSFGKSLLQLQKNVAGITDDDLIAEILTMLQEGHQTIAHTLSWFVYCMAQHPAMLETAYEDLSQFSQVRPLDLDTSSLSPSPSPSPMPAAMEGTTSTPILGKGIVPKKPIVVSLDGVGSARPPPPSSPPRESDGSSLPSPARHKRSTSRDVPSLLPPYCEAMLKESMRMYPVKCRFPTTLRHVRERWGFLANFDGENGEKKHVLIPKGCWILVNLYALHNYSKTWGPDARSFRPERWFTGSSLNTSPRAREADVNAAAAAADDDDDDDDSDREEKEDVSANAGGDLRHGTRLPPKVQTRVYKTSYAPPGRPSTGCQRVVIGGNCMMTANDDGERDALFAPFSCGARSCAGMHLAMMVIQTAVAELVSFYRFELADPAMANDEYAMHLNSTLHPIHHLPVRVRRRYE